MGGAELPAGAAVMLEADVSAVFHVKNVLTTRNSSFSKLCMDLEDS